MDSYKMIKDAERYRFLRNHKAKSEKEPHVVTEYGWFMVVWQKGKKLDQIVDTAIKKERNKLAKISKNN